jgi:hypothetical protein
MEIERMANLLDELVEQTQKPAPSLIVEIELQQRIAVGAGEPAQLLGRNGIPTALAAPAPRSELPAANSVAHRFAVDA